MHLFSIPFCAGESHCSRQCSGLVPVSPHQQHSPPQAAAAGGKHINFRDLSASNLCDLSARLRRVRMGNVILRSRLFSCEAEDAYSLLKTITSVIQSGLLLSCAFAARTSEN